MKKTIFLLAFIFMASVGYVSAQTLETTNVTALKVDKPLQHNAPTAKDDVMLTYLNGDLAYVIGNNNFTVGTTYYISGCIDFTATQMANFVGGQLHTISVAIPDENYVANLTNAKVWVKNTLNGAITYEQTFEPILGDFTDVELTTPQTITAGSYVIGYTLAITAATTTLRPLWCSDENDPYEPGGFNYLMGTSATAHGSGASWNQFALRGNLAIIGMLSGITLPANDLSALRVTSTAWPQLMYNSYTYTVRVKNTGTATQNNYTVQLINATDEVLATQTVTTALTPDATANVNLTYMSPTGGDLIVRGKVVLAGDQTPVNDVTLPTTFTIYPMMPMKYCDNSALSGVSAGANVQHQGAIGYPAASMTTYAGKMLTAIQVGLGVPASTISNASVWVRSTLTGATLYSQPFTPTVDGWNTVVLNTPYVLQNTDTYIGWSGKSTVSYILGTTANTQNAANGGHLQFGTNAWTTLAANNIGGNIAVIGMVAPDPNAPITITTDVTPANSGTVTGGGTYTLGDPVTLTATPSEGYEFLKWNTNSTDNPLNFFATVDATYTATFKALPCSPVTNPQVTFIEENEEIKAIITWNAVEGAREYEVTRDNNTTTVTNPEYTETFAFVSGTEYTWKIVTICPQGKSNAVTVKGTCNVGINETVKTTFSIVPNPAHNNIQITAATPFHTVEVVSFLGQTILSQTADSNSAGIDVSTLSNGVYFVRITTENGVSVKKFVKQ